MSLTLEEAILKLYPELPEVMLEKLRESTGSILTQYAATVLKTAMEKVEVEGDVIGIIRADGLEKVVTAPELGNKWRTKKLSVLNSTLKELGV